MNNLDKTKLKSRDNLNNLIVWDNTKITKLLKNKNTPANLKSIDRLIKKSSLFFNFLNKNNLIDEHERQAKKIVLQNSVNKALKERKRILFISLLDKNPNLITIIVNDTRKKRFWIFEENKKDLSQVLIEVLKSLLCMFKNNIVLFPSGKITEYFRLLCYKNRSCNFNFKNFGNVKITLEIYSHGKSDINTFSQTQHKVNVNNNFSNLNVLEEEAIYIMREAVAEAKNPVMLYSLGKDSSVMLHLAKKAFYPGRLPFPLLHIDTGWKFQSMYDFRDYIVEKENIDLLIFKNPEGEKKKINPFTNGSGHHTDIMKTQALKLALNKYNFDVAFGGARRDEEKSRSKERIFSFRNENHQWMSNKQRPELWRNYNSFKNNNESIRVFPLSNWTELDIWLYIYKESIPIIPLYFAQERPVVEKDGVLLLVDDYRMTANQEAIKIKKIRFRTLGCYPLTGAVESLAYDVPSIIMELLQAKTSERENRVIDNEANNSMESKKEDGYF